MNRQTSFYKFILLICLMAAALMILSGCRSRISDAPEAEETVSVEGVQDILQQYEDLREDLDLGQAPPPILQKPKTEPQTSETPSASPSAEGPGSHSNGPGGTGNGNGGKGNGGKGDKDSDKEKPKQTVTVRLDPAGGICEAKKLSVVPGRAYGALPPASREGYVFQGWFTAAEGGSQVTADTKVRSKKNHTLYAHWEKIGAETAFTVTFEANGGRIKKASATRTLRQGDAYGAFPEVFRDGYELEGWFSEPEGGAQVFDNMPFPGEGDQVLYAHWIYNPYAYWSYRLRNTTEKMYSCQVIACYVEFDEAGVTASSCPLLTDCRAQNVAMNRGDDIVVTDAWVNGKNPKAVIKCTGGDAEAAYQEMAQRFPGRRVLVAPAQAVYGNENEQLFYKLNLGILLYPTWFADIDLARAASELGVGGQILE